MTLSPAGLGAAATVASDCAVVAAFMASGPSGTVVLFDDNIDHKFILQHFLKP